MSEMTNHSIVMLTRLQASKAFVCVYKILCFCANPQKFQTLVPTKNGHLKVGQLLQNLFKSLTLYNTLISCLCDIPFAAYLSHWLCGRGATTANKSYLWSRINLEVIKEGIQGIPTCTLLLTKYAL